MRDFTVCHAYTKHGNHSRHQGCQVVIFKKTRASHRDAECQEGKGNVKRASLPSRLGGLEERRGSPQRGPWLSPGLKTITILVHLHVVVVNA